MEKLASIYERKGEIFVTAAHQTKAGFWIDDDRVVSLTQSTPEELGGAVELALALSRNDVPTPPPNQQIGKPLLEAAGVGSWATFMRLSKLVSISMDGDVLKATPYRNLGGRGGFEPQPDVAIQPPISASVLGETIMKIFSQRE
jgi:hypothetical protein